MLADAVPVERMERSEVQPASAALVHAGKLSGGPVSALSESLVAAQRQAIAALSKAYVAGLIEEPADLIVRLNHIGCTDRVEQEQLSHTLDVMREFGTAPEPAKPDTSTDMATKAQLDFAARLADEHRTVLPDYQLTKANASKVIEQLKAGTYNPDEWTVPF